MTTEELRAVAHELVHLHQRFASHFGRREAREHSLTYLQGLLLGEGRKSVEPIALAFATAEEGADDQLRVLALQRFLTHSPWQSADVQRELQAVCAEELVPSTIGHPVGVVGALDGSGFAKKGTESVGVARQYCGRLGKVENCQVGVFLVGVTPAGSALLDHQLYLPKSWISDRRRRKKARIPKGWKFQSKPQIGLELIHATRANGLVPLAWVTADEEYGRNGAFLDGLEAMGQRYLVEVPANTTVWTVDPATQPRPAAVKVSEVAAHLPASAWQTMQVREGTAGPLVFEFAAIRMWTVRHRRPGPAAWLVLRRSLRPSPELKYYVSNAAPETELGTLALVTGSHWRVEEFFEEGKSYLGMAHYEARAWSSWHHHMSLVALAHLFITLTRQRLKRKTPELTLDMALRLLRSTLALPKLTLEDSIAIVGYYLRRNRAAKQSHYKTWEKQHKNTKFKLLL